MAVRDDVDGRIEIELVEHAPTRREARRTAPPSQQLATPAAPAEDLAGDPRPAGRGRLVAVVAGVGTAGLLIGWLAGNAGGTEPAGAAVTQDSVAPGTTAPPPSFADDPALVEPDAPRITTSPDRRRLTTTTTTPEVFAVSPIPDIHPALVGLPYEIVTDDGRGQLRFIDLASNTLTTLDAPNGSDTGRLFAGDGWVLVPNGSSPRTLVYRDGIPDPYRILGFSPWNVLHQPGAPTMWRPDEPLTAGQAGNMIEIEPTGDPTGVAIALPRPATMIDSTGAFIVAAPGGTYVISAAGTSRLTTGEVIALGPTAALVSECDDALVCTYVVIDRVTGERRQLPNLFHGVRLQQVGWFGHESISPDGAVAFVQVPSWEEVSGETVEVQPRLFAVDLQSGDTTLIEGLDPWLAGTYWTADSQYAFFLANGEALAYSRERREVLRAGPDETSTRRPQAVAVRPADGTPWLER